MEEKNKTINFEHMVVDVFAALVGTVTKHMVEETFKTFSLEACPENVFSTYIYGLVDTRLEKQGKDKKELEGFLKTVIRVGTSVYEEERKKDGKNIDG